MKTYKFKMYSNHGNRVLHKTIDGHAEIWNHFIALYCRYYAMYGTYPGKKALTRHLTKLKRLPCFAHWNQLPSQSLQDVIDRLDKAYSKLDRKSGKRSGRPRFKRRKLYKSYTLKQAGWKLLQNNYIRIGKRIYRYFKSREVLGTPKRCTIKRDSIGDVWLIILTDHLAVDLESPTTGNNAGFDFGLKRYLTGSDFNDYDSPQFFKRGLNTIKRVNRNHSRKVPRSKNRARVDKWYPSSKTCHVCGAINPELNLRDRTWQCPSCHTELDRDRNAAVNIHRVGASTLSGEVVRPDSSG